MGCGLVFVFGVRACESLFRVLARRASGFWTLGLEAVGDCSGLHGA